MNLEEFISNELLPNTYKEVNLEVIEISQWKKLEPLEQEKWKGRVVVDNFDWMAQDKNLVAFSSKSRVLSKCDTINYYEQKFVGKKLTTFSVVGLSTTDGEKIKIKERRHVKMSEQKKNVNNLNDVDVDALLDSDNLDLGGENNIPNNTKVEAMTEFDEQGKTPLSQEEKDKRAAQRKLKAEKIEMGHKTLETLMETDIQNCPDLYIFNQKHGRYVCTVTQKDKAITVALTKKNKLDSQGNKIPKADTTPGAKTTYETESVISFKQRTPGKQLGAVIGIPEGGAFTYNDLRSDKAIVIDKEKTALFYSLFSMEEVYTTIPLLFNGEIKESEEVMGESSRTLQVISKQFYTKPTDKDGVQEREIPTVRHRLVANVASGSKKVILSNNYFPIETYELKDMLSMSEEDCAILNKTYFAGWNTTSTRKGQQTASISKYEKLSVVDKAKLTLNPDTNEITGSSFFRVGTPEKVSVMRFDDKNKAVTSLKIPFKKDITNASTGKVSSRFSVIKCTDPEQKDNPLSSLNSPEFSRIVSACHNTLTVEALSSLTATKSNPSNSGYLTPEEQRKLNYTMLTKTNESIQKRIKMDGITKSFDLTAYTKKLTNF